MRLFSVFCFIGLVLFTLSFTLFKAEDARVLYLNSGDTIEFVSAVAEGEFLNITFKNGHMKLPKTALADQSLKHFFPGSLPAPSSEAGKASTFSEPSPSLIKSSSLVSQTPVTADTPATMLGDLPPYMPKAPVLDKTKKFKAGKVVFEVSSKMIGNEKVKIHALLPRDKDGQIPATASDMVFYAPYMYFKGLADKPLDQDTRIYWELCEVYGMTVFTAEFNVKVEDVDDRKKCYYYPESGSFKVVFDAREKLIRDHNLLKKKMFIIGNSGGSSMAQRLGLSYEGDIAAVAMFGGGRYDPVETKVNISWLILNTRGDPRAPQNIELAQQLRSQGMNTLQAETEPLIKAKEDFLNQGEHNFHHSASELGFDLLQQYIVSISKMERDGTGNANTPQSWPMAASIANSFLISENTEKTSLNKKAAEVCFYPSKDFSSLWQIIPYRLASINQTDPLPPIPVTVRYPSSSVPPKAVYVVFNDNPELTVTSVDLLDFMAMSGCIALSASLNKSEKTRAKESQLFLEWVFKQKSLLNYPLILVGFGSGGRHLVIASSQVGTKPNAVVTIDTIFDWPFKEYSAFTFIKPLQTKFYAVVTPTNKEAQESAAKLYDAVKEGDTGLFQIKQKEKIDSLLKDSDFSSLDYVLGLTTELEKVTL